MTKLILIGSLFLIMGCNNPKSNNNVTIKNNQLLADLTDPFTIRNMDKICQRENCRFEKFLQKNKIDSTQNDTTYSFNYKSDTVNFYKSKENEFLINFTINSQSVSLGKNIKVGMTSDEIISLLNIKVEKIDTIFVETDMFISSTNVMKLIFQDNKLRKLTYYSIPD
jgi:hypothetical protein